MTHLVPEHILVEQLRNIAEKGPIWPGDTLSHAAADECVRRGYATRDSDGNFIVTIAGGARVAAERRKEDET